MRGSIAGLPEFSLKGENPSQYALLVILDSLFATLVVTPAVVGYWRSVWELMEIYVFPDDAFKGAIISTIIGISGHLVFTLGQHFFTRYIHPDNNGVSYFIISRLYTVCFAFVCVNGWRGPWLLLAVYTELDIVTISATTFVGVAALAAMRGLRNISAVPFSVVMDHVKGYFEVVTMFRVSIEKKTRLYILDCLFSVLVVGTLVVFVWRGAWVLIDIFLFPEDEKWSAWGSLVLGYVAVALAFILQPAVRWLCEHTHGALRLIVADTFLCFSFIGTVNVWRGVWNLLNLYFLPDNLELSCWITHWICLILLMLLRCSNTLLVRGVYIDAEEPEGKCVVFPIYYLRLIFQNEHARQISKKFKMEVAARRKMDTDGIKVACTCGAEIKNHFQNNTTSNQNHPEL